MTPTAAPIPPAAAIDSPVSAGAVAVAELVVEVNVAEDDVKVDSVVDEDVADAKSLLWYRITTPYAFDPSPGVTGVDVGVKPVAPALCIIRVPATAIRLCPLYQFPLRTIR